MIMESIQETRDISQENVMLAGGLRASETVQNLMPMDRVRSDDGEKDQQIEQQIGQKSGQQSLKMGPRSMTWPQNGKKGPEG